jgi:hypothetical protein
LRRLSFLKKEKKITQMLFPLLGPAGGTAPIGAGAARMAASRTGPIWMSGRLGAEAQALQDLQGRPSTARPPDMQQVRILSQALKAALHLP